ncbi:hypothetical protein [Streptomyces sp. NPDC050534]|uniref:hypothetical protein n=1 Tax=Streptomyces sp. NPDC050534 TaxID=3365625 RepID=UPI003793A3F3
MTVYDVARRLPTIAELRDLCRSLAMLDAILSPDWESRYYPFNATWAEGEEMASMRNGSGDEYSIVFSAAGVYVRGFGHESPMSPYGHDGKPRPAVIDDVPDVFKPLVEEAAFTDEDGVPVVTALVGTDLSPHQGRCGSRGSRSCRGATDRPSSPAKRAGNGTRKLHCTRGPDLG